MTKTKEIIKKTPIKIDDFQVKEVLSKFDFRKYLISIFTKNNIRYKDGGNVLIAECPFEKTKTGYMSFVANLEENIFCCFNCNVSGNPIDFVSCFYDIDFLEALYLVSSLTGYKKEDFNWCYSEESYKETKEKLKIHRINKKAAKFFYSSLTESKEALEYLKTRNLGLKEARNFGLGYDPDWEALKKHMCSLGYTEEELYEAGLLGKKERENEKIYYYDFFAGRLIIPIFDEKGNVSGFGGRTLEKDFKPKYINTRKTFAYEKNRIIYGFNFPKDENVPVILCEGYMDVISLRSAGFPAVATLGTALTEYHGELLKEHKAGVILAFDGDSAGLTAFERALGTLRKIGYKNPIYKLEYSSTEDPDEIINKENGINKMRDMLNNAVLKGEVL